MISLNNEVWIAWCIMSMGVLMGIHRRQVNYHRRQEVQAFIESTVMKLKDKDRTQKRIILLKDTLYNEETVQQLKSMNIDCEKFDCSFHGAENAFKEIDAIILETQQQDCLFAQNLRESGNRIPIYACSKHENWETLMSVIHAGMNGTLHYPLTAELVENVLNKEAI